jgi:hypothetical protein
MPKQGLERKMGEVNDREHVSSTGKMWTGCCSKLPGVGHGHFYFAQQFIGRAFDRSK